jgi:hypothetical protein
MCLLIVQLEYKCLIILYTIFTFTPPSDMLFPAAGGCAELDGSKQTDLNIICCMKC